MGSSGTRLESILSSWLIALVGFIYAYVAFEQLRLGNVSMAVVWSGYAFSQVGLWSLTK